MDDDHSAQVAEFCAISGATAIEASSYLESCNFTLDRALDMYFRGDVKHDEPPAGAPAAAAAPAAQQHQDYVEIIDDDEDEAGGEGLAELAQQRASALAAREQAAERDEELGAPPPAAAGAATGAAAAAGSSRQPGATWRAGGPSGAGPPADVDMAGPPGSMDEDDVQAMAAAIAAAEGVGADLESFHRRQQQELLAHYQQQAAGAQHHHLLAGQQLGGGGGGAAAAGAAAGDAAGAAAAAAAPGAAVPAAGAGADIPLDLPEGINIEEARMLEAAMLGIPYEGRMPNFGAAPDAAPLSPGTVEQRTLRQEQDAAYEESLALDRAKQESIAAAAAEAEAAERAQQEVEAAAAAEAASAAAALQALLAGKRGRLPAEPADGEAGSLHIAVRLPDGSRKGRRFRAGDPLQAVFDFVDVECTATDDSSGGGGGSIRPGAYRLVSQFPRKVLVEGSSGSLQDSGIASDSALFVELLQR